MTDEELTAIEARANKATMGPWFDIDLYDYDDPIRIALKPDADFKNGTQYITERDRVFIAAARTDVPMLIAEVRRLRETLMMIRDSDYDEDGYITKLRLKQGCELMKEHDEDAASLADKALRA